MRDIETIRSEYFIAVGVWQDAIDEVSISDRAFLWLEEDMDFLERELKEAEASLAEDGK